MIIFIAPGFLFIPSSSLSLSLSIDMLRVTSCQNEFQFHTSSWLTTHNILFHLHLHLLPHRHCPRQLLWGRRRKKCVCLRVHASPPLSLGASQPPICLLLAFSSSCSSLSVSTLENVTKISYWCLLFFGRLSFYTLRPLQIYKEGYIYFVQWYVKWAEDLYCD